MTPFEVPLQPATPQAFTIGLSGKTYRFTVTWCQPAACWLLAIDEVNGVRQLSGIPIVTGADLLAQYGYLNIGGALIAQTVNDPAAVPTFADLGATGKLFYVLQ